jgi:pSer/pThr/pTyr-binding forkhead associated (FHA) protein
VINFFFFRDGKGARAYYADPVFERPEKMTIDEEMLLYAFQPVEKVYAYIFRDMITATSEDSSQLDRGSLYKLLTVGYLKDRRSGNRDISSPPAGHPDNRAGGDTDISLMPATGNVQDRVKEKPKLPSIVLSVESGPQQGERFTVTLPCTIGRKECDLILEDRLISRRHAELRIVGKNLVIEDLASTNGTRVNGTAVTTKHLVPNDLISIGPANLRISRAT